MSYFLVTGNLKQHISHSGVPLVVSPFTTVIKWKVFKDTDEEE